MLSYVMHLQWSANVATSYPSKGFHGGIKFLEKGALVDKTDTSIKLTLELPYGGLFKNN